VISHAEDIEEIGYKGIVKKIREVVGENPVYRECPLTSRERRR
jgi:agmatinase